MKVAVTPDIRQRADELFPSAEVNVVCAGLADGDLPLVNNHGESVHFSIPHLSLGGLAHFRARLALAKIDWRDVLVSARGH